MMRNVFYAGKVFVSTPQDIFLCCINKEPLILIHLFYILPIIILHDLNRKELSNKNFSG